MHKWCESCKEKKRQGEKKGKKGDVEKENLFKERTKDQIKERKQREEKKG